MDHHGVNMKGKYYLETRTASEDASGGLNLTIDFRRLILNASNDKMYYCTTSKWLRPLVANDDDAPDQNEVYDLGNSSARWRRIYVGDSGSGGIYGQVRYS